MLPFYIRNVNIFDTPEVAEKVQSGELLHVSRELLLKNPFVAAEYQAFSDVEKMQLLINTAVVVAPLAQSFNQRTPLILVGQSAFNAGCIDNRELIIYGGQSGRSGIVFNNDFEIVGLPERFREDPNFEFQIALNRFRTKRPIDMATEVSEFHVIKSQLLDDDALYEFVDETKYEAARKFFNKSNVWITKPDRTLYDLIGQSQQNNSEELFATMLETLSHCGVTFLPDHKAQDYEKITELEEKYFSETGRYRNSFRLLIDEYTRCMDHPELVGESRRQFINKMRIMHREANPFNVLNVWHYNTKQMRLLDIGEGEWRVDAEGWLGRINPQYDSVSLPPVIQNLMPELGQIKPTEYVRFLQENSRYLSNIQILPTCESPSNFDYIQGTLTDSPVFEGINLNVPLADIDDIKVLEMSLAKPRTKVSGHQYKLPVCVENVFGELQMSLADNKPFTHLLKFESQKLPGIAVAEWYGMCAARAGALNVPKFQLMQYNSIESDTYNTGHLAYIIERFDIPKQGSTEEILALELSSLMALSPEQKYQTDVKMVAKAIEMYSSDFKKDAEVLLRQLTVSTLIGNNDLHAKNLSMLLDTETKYGRLSPIYDCTACAVIKDYHHLSMALPIDGESFYTPSLLIDFSIEHLHMDRQQALNTVLDVMAGVRHFTETVVAPECVSNSQFYSKMFDRCQDLTKYQLAMFASELDKDFKLQSQSNFGDTIIAAISERLNSEFGEAIKGFQAGLMEMQSNQLMASQNLSQDQVSMNISDDFDESKLQAPGLL